MPSTKRPCELEAGETQDGPSKALKRQIDPAPDEITPALKKYIAGAIEPYERRIATLEGHIVSLKRHFGDLVMDMGGLEFSPPRTTVSGKSTEERLAHIKRHLAEAVMDLGGFGKLPAAALPSSLWALPMLPDHPILPLPTPSSAALPPMAQIATAPAQVRPVQEQNPTTTAAFATAMMRRVKREVNAAYEELAELTDSGYKKGVTNDDFPAAMTRFIPDVEQLADCAGGIAPAFELFMHIAERSYADLNVFPGYGDSEEDYEEDYEQLDDAMLVIAQERFKAFSEDHSSLIETSYTELKRVADKLDEFGVEGYYPQTIGFLKNRRVLSLGDAQFSKTTFNSDLFELVKVEKFEYLDVSY